MKRILMSLATVGALSALITGATFALFTDSTSNIENTFTAGTVELGKITTFECDLGDMHNLAPGDSGSCSAKITYSGSLDAWIGVTYSTSGDLFDEEFGDYPMTVSLSGGSHTDEHGVYVLGLAEPGDTLTVTGSYALDLRAGNEYQGATGTIEISVQAVQARNNTKSDDSGPISWN